jgi:hypothetical protein
MTLALVGKYWRSECDNNRNLQVWCNGWGWYGNPGDIQDQQGIKNVICLLRDLSVFYKKQDVFKVEHFE